MKKWIKMLIIGLAFVVSSMFIPFEQFSIWPYVLLGIGIVVIIISLIVGFSRLMAGLLTEE